MVEARATWWAERTQRERSLLLALAALLLVVASWFLLLRPLADARAAAEARLEAAVTELGRARAAAAAEVAQAGAAPALPGPLDEFLRGLAAEAGLNQAQVAAQGEGRASVTVPSVLPQPFFAWLAQMEARGLVVDSMNVRANPDNSIAAELVLRVRGG